MLNININGAKTLKTIAFKFQREITEQLKQKEKNIVAPLYFSILHHSVMILLSFTKKKKKFKKNYLPLN